MLIAHKPTVSMKIGDHPRRLYLSRAAQDWCFPKGRHPDRVSGASLAALHDQMNAFVAGHFIENEVDLKQLLPRNREVWEIRALLQPQLRAFGWFADRKCLIVTHGKRRDQLGERGSTQWERAIEQVVRFRQEHFAGLPPHRGINFEDCVG